MKSAAHHQGLSEQQVLENRTKYGVNILTPPVKEPLWKQFLEKFSDPIIKILLVALLLSVGVACYQFFTGAEPASVFLEPVGILVAILLATCVGFAFEVSANKKFEILNQVNDETMVQVIRGGQYLRTSPPGRGGGRHRHPEHWGGGSGGRRPAGSRFPPGQRIHADGEQQHA